MKETKPLEKTSLEDTPSVTDPLNFALMYPTYFLSYSGPIEKMPISEKAIKEVRKEQKKQQENFLLNFVSDLILMNAGGAVGGLIGKGITKFLPKIIPNIGKILNIVTKGSRIAGETAGLTAAGVAIHKEKPEEAIKGAIVGQGAGIALAGIGKIVYKTVGKTKTAQKVTNKARESLHKLLFDKNIPEDIFKEAVHYYTPSSNVNNIVKRLADSEIKKLSKNPKDWEKIIETIKQEAKTNPEYAQYLKANSIEDIDSYLEKLNVFPNKHSAELLQILEAALFPQVKEKIPDIIKKYPVLFKEAPEYKKSTKEFFELVAPTIANVRTFSEQQLPELKLSINSFVKKSQELLGKIISGKTITKDELKSFRKESKSIIKTLLENKSMFDKDSKKEITKIIKYIKASNNVINRHAISSLRRIEKFQKFLSENVIKDITKNIDSIKSIKDLSDDAIKAITSKMNVIKEKLKSPVIDKAVSKDIINTAREIVSISRISNKETRKVLGDVVKSLVKANKYITKLFLYQEKLIEKTKKSIIKTGLLLDELSEKLSSLAVKDIEKEIKALHDIYITRGFGVLPSVKKGVQETKEKIPEDIAEYQFENLFSTFFKHNIEAYDALKRRLYPTLISKYKDFYESGKKIVFSPSEDVTTVYGKTYALPQFLKATKDLFRKIMLKEATIKQRIEGVIEGGKIVEVEIPLVFHKYSMPERFKEIFEKYSGLEKFYKYFDKLGEYYVHQDLVDVINRFSFFALGGNYNIFSPKNNLLMWYNTLAKRIAVLFGLIHFKSLSTAAYGAGFTKELKQSWKAVAKEIEDTFAGQEGKYFEEYIQPLARETVDLINKYELKTNFFLASYDDVREQMSRLMMHANLDWLKNMLNKMGLVTKTVAKFDELLWDRLFYTLKVTSARNILHQLEKGEITKEQATLLLNKIAGIYGGNIEWYIMKPEAREFIRLLAFAPDWYLTLIRHYTGAVEGIPIFSDFFRRIFMLHYIITNELNYQINGRSSFENFLITKDWRDLFAVWLYTKSIADEGGKAKIEWKRSKIFTLGFEIEGAEFLGIIPFVNMMIEYATTNKSLSQAAKDAVEEWASYIATKRSSLLRSIIDAYRALSEHRVLDALEALPTPILGSSLFSIVNKKVTFDEAGEKVNPLLIGFITQLGLKFYAYEKLGQELRNVMILKVDDKSIATDILKKYLTEINNVSNAIKSVKAPLSVKLKSNDPKKLFDNVIVYAIEKHIKERYGSDIKTAVKEGNKAKLRDIYIKILEDFKGTVLSYYPRYNKLVSQAFYGQIKKNVEIYKTKQAGENEKE